jgi:hypothetical protein
VFSRLEEKGGQEFTGPKRRALRERAEALANVRRDVTVALKSRSFNHFS